MPKSGYTPGTAFLSGNRATGYNQSTPFVKHKEANHAPCLRSFRGCLQIREGSTR
jgi:hypothetical protein